MGKRASSTGRNSNDNRRPRSTGASTPGARCGYRRACGSGRSSRAAELASIAHRRNFHEAMHDALRVQHAWHCSGRRRNRPALRSARGPLLARVAESTVIFGPCPVGMLRASAGVTWARLSTGRSRKRAGAGGEGYAGERGGRMPLDALKDGIVLAVDRQERAPRRRASAVNEFAASTRISLWRAPVFAGGQGREGGPQARGADTATSHDVGAGSCARSMRPLSRRATRCRRETRRGRPSPRRGRLLEHADLRHAEFPGDGGEPLPIGRGRDAHQLQFVGMRGEHTQRVFTDRTGGSERTTRLRAEADTAAILEECAPPREAEITRSRAAR